MAAPEQAMLMRGGGQGNPGQTQGGCVNALCTAALFGQYTRKSHKSLNF
jgi:hypothetical protein